jgi:prolipoprotein diacylglyceryltransferase
MIVCFKAEIIDKVIKARKVDFYQMAEAGMAAFGAAAGVAIALAVVTFALRGKGHPEPLD